MLKNILKLNGAQEMSKSEQKEVNGGMLTRVGKGGAVCTGNNTGAHCGPPHCPGECGFQNGEPFCLPY